MAGTTVEIPTTTGGSGTVTAPVQIANGSAATPSYSFSSRTGDGMYDSGSALAWAVGGASRMTLDSSGNLVTVGGVTVGASSLLTFSGRSTLQSTADGYLVLQNNAGTDAAGGLRFGGTTASYAMWKRAASSTVLAARLADDSADAPVSAAAAAFSGAVSLPNGSFTAPSTNFGTDKTGIYQLSAGALGIAIAGAKGAQITKSGNILKLQNLSAAANGNGFVFYCDNDVLAAQLDTSGLVIRSGGVAASTAGSNAPSGAVIWSGSTTHGGYGQVVSVEAVTGAMSGATVTLTNLIPAGAILLGLAARVTTTVTGATSINIGDGSNATAFGSAIALAAGTTTTNASWTLTSAPVYAAATSVVLTAVGSNFTGGVVRVLASYATCIAPTS